jgi:thiamine pyrophosphate-dependent acetolactate synthase large subunit-like protein
VQAVAEELRQAGTQDLFGVLGAGNLAFVGCAVDEYGMRYYALRHESAAVAAADSFARVTGHVGVATVTHGPGLTHASSAIVEAAKSAVPLLVVTSSVTRAAPHHNQAVDQVGLVRALGAAPFVLAEATDTRQTVQQALRYARSQGQPTILMLPEDLQDAEVEEADSAAAEMGDRGLERLGESGRPGPCRSAPDGRRTACRHRRAWRDAACDDRAPAGHRPAHRGAALHHAPGQGPIRRR